MDQLEKTQKCNGVVQDDPETILRLMEKVDVLFAKIKVSAPETAHVYGQVLSLIVRDLIPAKDVLTKVIKEMLISQPHIEVVAQILHQVRVEGMKTDLLRGIFLTISFRCFALRLTLPTCHCCRTGSYPR